MGLEPILLLGSFASFLPAQCLVGGAASGFSPLRMRFVRQMGVCIWILNGGSVLGKKMGQEDSVSIQWYPRGDPKADGDPRKFLKHLKIGLVKNMEQFRGA